MEIRSRLFRSRKPRFLWLRFIPQHREHIIERHEARRLSLGYSLCRASIGRAGLPAAPTFALTRTRHIRGYFSLLLRFRWESSHSRPIVLRCRLVGHGDSGLDCFRRAGR